MDKKLEEAITKCLQKQAQRLLDSGARDLEISINIKKATYDDTPLISYECSSGYGSNVTGNNLHATVTEFMRRKGWNEENKPMVLIEAPSELVADE